MYISRTTKGYRIFRICNVFIMIIAIIVTLFPVLNVVAKSFSSAAYINANKITFYPKGFNVNSYQYIMKDMNFWIDYKNTIVYTLVGTFISLVMTSGFAYALSVPRLKGKSFFMKFIVFTMFFGGGMIPNYLLIKGLGMYNTMWAIVVPGAISTFLLILMKTFFESLPRELEEAASIDGMDTYGILLHIVLPLSTPILATITLFYAVGAWNNWFGPFLYLDQTELQPVTLYLRNIIQGALSPEAAQEAACEAANDITANIKCVTIVLTALPILCVYPFLQKYFVQGMMIGSIKA